MSKSGNLYIVSAPSGAGKTSLLKALTERTDGISTSVSTTTRPKREGEVEGVDYHFANIDDFKEMVEQNDFLEHAEVFGNHYGTSRTRLNAVLLSGKDLILEIDWQGAQQIKQQLPSAISIFILPPSRDELERRLKGRGQDDQTVIDHRMSSAIAEISHYDEYDFLIINDDFELALNELCYIVHCHRLSLSKQASKFQQLIKELL